MTLQQLKYIIEVADKGSINKAAKSLYVSQPSLSNAISDLENKMNITIFHRTSKGVTLTDEGAEFLLYARQVVKQAELLEDRYKKESSVKQVFAVSTEQFSMAILSFCELVKEYGLDSYQFKLRETKTHEIIQDVIDNKSEVGVIYLNTLNEKPIKNRLKDNNLEYTQLFVSRPRILVSTKNPLAGKDQVALEDLADYPCLSFEQEESNLFFFSHEILSAIIHRKNIKVSERATLFTLMSELNGYTISTGIISDRLRRMDIIPVELDVNSFVRIGMIVRRDRPRSDLGEAYIKILKQNIDSML